jgi:hypothetical protein
LRGEIAKARLAPLRGASDEASQLLFAAPKLDCFAYARNDGFDTQLKIHATAGLTFTDPVVISTPPGTSGHLAFELEWRNDGIDTIERRPR